MRRVQNLVKPGELTAFRWKAVETVALTGKTASRISRAKSRAVKNDCGPAVSVNETAAPDAL